MAMDDESQTDSQKLVSGFIGAMGPVFAILGLTLMLCVLATVVVFAITAFIPKFYKNTRDFGFATTGRNGLIVDIQDIFFTLFPHQ